MAQAQLPWVRQVELKCAYHRDTIYDSNHHIHEFLLFYGNDSVVHVIMAGWEGYYEVNAELPADTLITRFIEEFHCEPEDFTDDSHIYTYWFAGASLVWKDTYYSVARFEQDDAILSWEGTRFKRLLCWNRVVHPKKRIPWWSSGCSGDPEP